MPTKTAAPTLDPQALVLMDEEDSRQFVLVVSGHRARMEYDRTPDRIFLTHLTVPAALDVNTVSAILTEKVLEWVDSKRMKVVPISPYVKTYLRKHTAWQRLLVKGVQI